MANNDNYNLTGGMYGWYQEGDWVDTVSMAQNGLVRVPFKRFVGKHIMHCHVLHHADKDGMVRVMNVREALDDSTCCGDMMGVGCDTDYMGQVCCSKNIPFEDSRYDLTCANGGLGCNAGGFNLCRFCGGDVFEECGPLATIGPTTVTSSPTTSPPVTPDSPTNMGTGNATTTPSMSQGGGSTPLPSIVDMTVPTPNPFPAFEPTLSPKSLRPISDPTNPPGDGSSPTEPPVDFNINDFQSGGASTTAILANMINSASLALSFLILIL